jgi:zinc transport system substrate-binding protein
MSVPRPRRAGLAVGCLVAVGAMGCGRESPPDARPQVVVSVLPQKYFVERIAGDAVRVAVMIPPGASPATWEPGLDDLRELASAALYVKVGHPAFPFERTWLDRLLSERADLPVVDSSAGTSPGEDPHVWVSPSQALRMAQRIHEALVKLLPERRAELDAGLAALRADIERVDAEIRRTLADRRGAAFVVYHPAWGAFAREYGLEQVAIESQGKEPDPRELARVIARARALGTPVVFAQAQFDRRAAELVAGEIGARVETIDPLAYDWPQNLLHVAARVAEAAR